MAAPAQTSEAGPWRVHRFASLGSTNDEARTRLSAGEPPPFAVLADGQTAGRGRRGRAWLSQPGNLYASLAIRPEVPAPAAAQLSFAAALAVHEALAGLTRMGDRLSLKWPNDVLLDGAKLAGLLLEAVSAGPAVDQLVIGIGINLADCPQDLPYRAAALSQVLKPVPPPEAVLHRILASFDRFFAAWRRDGFAALRDPWLARATGLGRAITVRLPDRAIDGTFEGLDEDGALLLRRADGQVQSYTAGDVFLGSQATMTR